MKTKKRCSKCDKIYNSRCFIFNKLVGEKICNKCNKKIGTNKFYSGELKQKSNKFISKYNMTDTEKEVLVNKLMREGHSKDEAFKKINSHSKTLRSMREKSKEKRIQDEKREEKNKQKQVNTQLNFLKGLGQK